MHADSPELSPAGQPNSDIAEQWPRQAWQRLESVLNANSLGDADVQRLSLAERDALRLQLQALLDLLQPPDDDAGTPVPERVAAQRHLQRGKDCHLQGDYQQAVLHFTAALRFDPTDGRLYAHRGESYRLQCEYERALADFHLALRFRSADPYLLQRRAAANHLCGEHEAAIADCDAALALEPANAEAYGTRAAALAALGSSDRALADWSEAINLAPNDDGLRFQRGLLHAVRRNFDSAVADFDRVLRRNPHHVGAYLNRGHALRGRGEYAGAIRDYSEALRLHPDNVLAYGSRALTYRLKGHTDRALADYTAALRLEPGDSALYYGRGVLHRIKANLALAEADLDEAVRRAPDRWKARYHRGKVYLLQGKLAQAHADFTAVLAREPNRAVAYLSRALVHDQLNQTAEAIADAGRAIELDGQLALAWLARGWLHLHAADYAAAIADLSEALRLDERLAAAYRERATALALRGDYDRVLVDCDRLLALDPSDARAYALRSVAFHCTDRVQNSLIDYTQALQLDPRAALIGWSVEGTQAARMTMSGWLADAIDGLRRKPQTGKIPPPSRWRIAVQARGSREADARDSEKPAIAAPKADATQRDAAADAAVDVAVADLLTEAPEPPITEEFIVNQSARHVPAAVGAVNAMHSRPASTSAARSTARVPIMPPVRKRPRHVLRPPTDDQEETGWLVKWKKPRRVAALAGALALAYFCFPVSLFGTGNRVSVYPAHGRVLFDEQPVPGATVLLEPALTVEPRFPRPQGVVKDDGTFALSTYGKDDGAPAGEYKVLVQWFIKTDNADDDGAPLPTNYLPPRYGRFESSGLQVRIAPTDNQIPAFKLTR